MANQSTQVRNEILVEFRYQPNSRILDFRGTWAKAISEYLELSHWQIVENRFDMFNDDKTFRCFVGFRNAGMAILDSPERNYFSDQAIKFYRFLFKLDGFNDPIFAERLGVRSKYCDPYKNSFDELRDKFSSIYISITDRAKDAIGRESQLVDVGAPLNFVDKLGNFNTISGPMIKSQFPNFFTKDEVFPDVGFYYDIDYWIKPQREMQGGEILKQIKDFALASWDRHDRIKSLLIED